MRHILRNQPFGKKCHMVVDSMSYDLPPPQIISYYMPPIKKKYKSHVFFINVFQGIKKKRHKIIDNGKVTT